MFKLKLITLLRLDFINRRIKERISSIVWRFLLFDALVYGSITPLIYILAFIISYFFFPGFTFDMEVVIMMCILSPTILLCMSIIFHVLDSTYNTVATGRSMAMYMFHNWKLRLGWAKFCVIQKKELLDQEWMHYKFVDMRKHKKVYYDDPQKAALAIWMSGFSPVDDLSQMFTLLIRGREYDLPKLKTTTVEAIKEHIEQCLEMDKAFYDKATSDRD